MKLLTKILRWIRRLTGDYKAWWRGERRIAPKHAVRGRLYEKKDDPKAKAGPHFAKPRATVKVTGRVIRANGTIEDIGPVSAEAIETKQ